DAAVVAVDDGVAGERPGVMIDVRAQIAQAGGRNGGIKLFPAPPPTITDERPDPTQVDSPWPDGVHGQGQIVGSLRFVPTEPIPPTLNGGNIHPFLVVPQT